MPISFTIKEEGLICAFSGRMDTESCMEIKTELNQKIEGHKEKVVFDLGEVDYISSSFLRICAKAATAVGNENFSIIRITPGIKKVFMIAGIAKLLNIE